MRLALAPVAALALTSCVAGSGPPPARPIGPVTTPRPVTPPTSPPRPATPVVGTAVGAGVIAGPDISTLPVTEVAATRALAAFRTSCGELQRRTDRSGLTQRGDWAAPCTAAASAGGATRFFRDNFETVQVGPGTAFATGYYEPEIAGSRTRDAAHQVPVYPRPADLIDVDLGLFSDALKGKTIRGRTDGTNFVPYFDRAEIDAGALNGRVVPIAWAADYIELFFLQVQGSGRLRLPDGSVMRIGYGGQNGRDYTGIGALMRNRGLLGPNQQSMQGIMAWLRANPTDGMAIMHENKSYIFFRELTGAGPIGAMGVAVSANTTVAADPAFVPLGAPVWLDLDRAEADGLWVAQDTGGAIKGANRFDTFWGAGDDARRIAGGMSGRGTALILVPRGTLARLNASTTVGNVTPLKR